jgi:hypothetical protein
VVRSSLLAGLLRGEESCTAEVPTDAEADEMEEHLRGLDYIE